jgi:hypothetical protein
MPGSRYSRLCFHLHFGAVVSRRQVDDTAALLHSAHDMAARLHSVPGKGHAMPQVSARFISGCPA